MALDTMAASAAWQRSPYCAGGSCVEIATDRGEILIRDSKLADSPILRFTREEWAAFAAGVKEDAFTLD
jgi:hypothetical protein